MLKNSYSCKTSYVIIHMLSEIADFFGLVMTAPGPRARSCTEAVPRTQSGLLDRSIISSSCKKKLPIFNVSGLGLVCRELEP